MSDLHDQLLEAAVAWHTAGAFVCPPDNDGSKAPSIKQWKQTSHADRGTLDEVVDIYTPGTYDGIGIFTGTRSIDIECTEFEGRAVAAGLLNELDQLAEDNDMADLVGRILEGYVERTPSGGIHLIYRVADGGVRKNTVLAKDENDNVLAESRGNGGYVILAPSGGRVHESGLPYEVWNGTPEDLITLTIEERDQFWALIRLLDKAPADDDDDPTPKPVLPGGGVGGQRPGDEFNERADWDTDILGPAGWTRAYRMGDGYAWRKPDKKSRGISATTGQSSDGIDRLYVFSTSTEFQAEKPYTKFAAWAILNHGGDYAAAARALAAQGYGSHASILPTIPPAGPGGTAGSPAPASQATTTQAVQAPAPAPAAAMFESEDGAALMLVNEHARDIRYCPQMGRWLYWTGSLWQPQESGGMVQELVRGLARRLPANTRPEIQHKKRISSASGVTSVLKLASTDPAIVIHIDELDQRITELNTPAGTINLLDGTLQPSSPAALHTKSTRVAPDFTAPQDAWNAYLEETFAGPDQAQLIGFVQRLLGYALLGEVRDAILPVFYGSGANGKTVLVEVVSDLLGDYAVGVNQKFLVQGPDRHSTEIAKLAGVRLAIASETNEGERFDEAKVKLLTGGDRLTARFMRQDETTFRPSHTLIQLTNHKPDVQSGGRSFWRRLRLVPFENTVPDDKIDTELRQKLVRDHGGAIMAWLVQGAVQYLQGGLAAPEAVRAATEEYALETDTVAQFLASPVVTLEEGRVDRGDTIYRAFETWCEASGFDAMSKVAFGRKLTSHGLGYAPSHKGSGSRMRGGIEINQAILAGLRDGAHE